MSWAIIRESDGVMIATGLAAEPTAADGEYVIEEALGLGELCEWSAARRAFVYTIASAPLMTVGRFKLLMTAEERVAIRAAARVNDQIDDFLDVLNGFSDGVSLSDPLLIAGIAALQSAGLLTVERAASVLAGNPPD
jgi:hypothetical protein